MVTVPQTNGSSQKTQSGLEPKRVPNPLNIKEKADHTERVREFREKEAGEPQERLTPLEQIIRDEVAVLNSIRDRSRKISLDSALKEFKLSNAFKHLHPDTIRANLDSMWDQWQETNFNKREFVLHNPVTIAHMRSHPYFANLTLEQIDTIKRVEDLINLPLNNYPMSPDSMKAMAERLTNDTLDRREALGILEVSPAGQIIPRDKAQATLLAQNVSRLKRLNEFTSGSEKIGPVETLVRRFDENDAFFLPFFGSLKDVANVKRIYDAAKAVHEENATQAQRDSIILFDRLVRAKQRRGQTLGADVASIVAELPAFLGEFAATGPVYRGAKAVVLRGLREYADTTLKRLALKAIAATAGTATQTPFAMAPRIAKDAIERMTPGMAVQISQGTFAIRLDMGEAEPITVAIAQAITDSWIEMASERTGAIFTHLGRPVNQLLFSRWLKKHPSGTVSAFQSFLNAAGWNGVLGEMGEEEVGKLMRDIAGLEEYRLPTRRELAAQGIAFGIIPAAQISAGVLTGKIELLPEPPITGSSGMVSALVDLVEKSEKQGIDRAAVERQIQEASVKQNRPNLYVNARKFEEEISGKESEEGDNLVAQDVYEELTGSSVGYQDAVRLNTDIKIPAAKLPTMMELVGPTTLFQDEFVFDRREPRKSSREQDAEERKEQARIAEELRKSEEPAAVAGTPNQDVVSTPESTPVPESVDDAPRAITQPEETQDRSIGREAEPGELKEDQKESAEDSARREPTPMAISQLGGQRKLPVLAVTPEQQASVDKVRKEVETNLRDQNLPQLKGLRGLRAVDIENMANFVTERFARRAELLGVDAFELFQSEGLTFEALDEPSVSVEKGEVHFQTKRKKRGRTVVSQQGIKISLFKDADRSTFFHENGHVWLVEMQADVATLSRRKKADLTDRQKLFLDDANAVLESMGIDSWSKLTRAKSEIFAKGVETWVFKGTVSNPKLRRPFARFGQWLRKLYNSLKNIGVLISPEISEVMDRFVSVPNLVVAAERREEINLLFGEKSGLTEKQQERYQKALVTVRQKAEEILSTRYLANVRRREEDDWKLLRKIVEQELSNEPVYAAFSVLSAGKLPDGRVPDLPSGAQPYKLSRADIVGDPQYGKKALDALPSSVWGKEGVHPDFAARDFGFRDGKELVTGLTDLFEQEKRQIPEVQQERELNQKIADLRSEQEDLSKSEKGIKRENKKLQRELEKVFTQQIESEIDFIEGQITEFNRTGEILPDDAARIRDNAEEEIPTDDALVEPFLKDTIKKLKRDIKTKVPKEAQRIATRKVAENVELLISNVRQQESLKAELKVVEKDRRVVVRSVRKSGQINRIIDRVTDQRYELANPITRSDEDILDEGLRALHNEDRSKLLRLELELLASKNVGVFHGLQRAITQSPKRLEDYRENAEREVMKGTARDLTPFTYQRAEKAARRAARAALRRGDVEQSFLQKELELENHIRFMVAERMQKFAEKEAKFARGLKKKSRQIALGKAKGGYRDRVNQYLEDYEVVPRSAETVERRTSFRDWFEKEKKTTGLAPEIPEHVQNDASRRNFRDIPLTELVEVFNSLRHIVRVASLKNKLLASVDKREFDEIIDNFVASVGEHGPPTRPPTAEAQRERGRFRKRGAAFLAMQRTAASLFKQMDGWTAGPLTNAIILPADKAEVKKIQMKQDATLFMRDLFKKTFPLRRSNRLNDMNEIPELDATLSREAMISTLLNWGNLDSRRKVVSGFRTSLRNSAITEQQVQEGIINRLSKEEVEFAQAIWDYFDDVLWPEVKALSDRVDPIPAEKVDAAEVTTPHGNFRGGYFPLKYDFREPGGELREIKTEDDAKEDVEEAIQGKFWRSTSKSGHRKRRVDGGKRPLRLNFGVIFEHLDEVIHDVTHYELLVDITRIIHSPKLKREIIERYGSHVWDELEAWRDDLATGGAKARNQVEKSFQYIRTGTQMAVLGFKLTTALMQPLGITNSVALLGAGNVTKGLGRVMGGPTRGENTSKWIASLSQFMRLRKLTIDRELAELQTNIAKFQDRLPQWQAWSMYGVIKMQAFADNVTWAAAYEKFSSELGLGKKENSEKERQAILDRVVLLSDRAVRESQGSGLVKDLPRIMRGGPILKLFTLFGTFFNARWNTAREAIGRNPLKTPGDYGRLTTDFLSMYAAPAVLAFLIKEAIRAGGEEDEEFDFARELIEAIAREPLGDLILIREMTGSIGYKYRGPAGLKIFAETSDLFNQIGQGEFDTGLIRELNDVGGIVFHYPSEQIEDLFEGFASWEQRQTGPGAMLIGPGQHR